MEVTPRKVDTKNIHHLYIAEGLADDCEELLNRCMKVSKLSYEKFCDIWREMEFVCIFHNRLSGAELAEFSEEAVHVAKYYMVSENTNFERTVAGLFLVYAITRLQPYPKFAVLRLVPEDVKVVKNIEITARKERRHDILYILGEILIRGPTEYHASARERAIDFSLSKYFSGFTQHSPIGMKPVGVLHRYNPEIELLKQFGELETQYKNVKKGLTVTNPKIKLNYINDRCGQVLFEAISKMIPGLATKKDRPVAAGQLVPSEPADKDNPEDRNILKKRAMEGKVDGIRHLIGVEEKNKKPEPMNPKKKPKAKSQRSVILSHFDKKTEDEMISPPRGHRSLRPILDDIDIDTVASDTATSSAGKKQKKHQRSYSDNIPADSSNSDDDKATDKKTKKKPKGKKTKKTKADAEKDKRSDEDVDAETPGIKRKATRKRCPRKKKAKDSPSKETGNKNASLTSEDSTKPHNSSIDDPDDVFLLPAPPKSLPSITVEDTKTTDKGEGQIVVPRKVRGKNKSVPVKIQKTKEKKDLKLTKVRSRMKRWGMVEVADLDSEED